MVRQTPTNQLVYAASQEDREFFARELDSFVPARVYDAHLHLWPQDQIGDRAPGFPSAVGAEEYRRMIDDLHPGRSVSSLFIPFPAERDRICDANQWIASQIDIQRGDRGLFFIQPEDDPEWVRQEVRRLGLHGLKCYHTMSTTVPTWESDVPSYLPEPLVKVAHEEGWVITLHLVKSRAVADPANIHWVRHYCRTYPGMRLILAHSGRGFQPAHNLEGLPQLKDLENLYFDTSVNCEPIAHQAILRLFGHRRLMYGSDFFISNQRGRSLGAADSFLWLYETNPVWDVSYGPIRPVLIGLEHLRSLKWACWSAGLSDSQVEDIFWNNAAELLGVRPSGAA